jgi:histidyl-tRNA synthetase
MSGVGISFGADRIYDVLVGLDKFPRELESSTTLLFANMDPASLRYILPVAKALRDRGISVEVYPDSSKLKKQFEYAERKAIPFISINGENEASAGQVNIKNLSTGDQEAFPKNAVDEVIRFLS